MTIVPFPLFELVGPPCKKPPCQGTLIATMSLKTKEYFLRCAKCESNFDIEPINTFLWEEGEE
jgi:hypothetical protein